MSEENKEKDEGGLMYQQLRKFISVIVSQIIKSIEPLVLTI